MNHWIVVPVVLPLMCGALLVLLAGRAPALIGARQRRRHRGPAVA